MKQGVSLAPLGTVGPAKSKSRAHEAESGFSPLGQKVGGNTDAECLIKFSSRVIKRLVN